MKLHSNIIKSCKWTFYINMWSNTTWVESLLICKLRLLSIAMFTCKLMLNYCLAKQWRLVEVRWKSFLKFLYETRQKKVASEHTRIKSIEWGCDWKGEKLQEKWSTKCSYNSKENVLICRDRHQTLCPNCSNIIA